jgi:hypothetical protein
MTPLFNGWTIPLNKKKILEVVPVSLLSLFTEKWSVRVDYEAQMPRIAAPVIRAKTIWADVPSSWESARSTPL